MASSIKPDVLAQFVGLYQNLNKNNVEQLGDLYHLDIHFIDPIHQIKGLASLKRYFSGLYENTLSCQFTILSSDAIGQGAYVSWQMHYQHKKIGAGKMIKVDGLSKLHFEGNKIIYHRDYFDLTQMLFDHLPLIGCTTQYIKQKAAQF